MCESAAVNHHARTGSTTLLEVWLWGMPQRVGPSISDGELQVRPTGISAPTAPAGLDQVQRGAYRKVRDARRLT
ncbi:hypothetical protein GCM10025781_27230 [Kocuria gwangalliensis]|uniref:Uncharacterized protein n=1 Tax=Kocuria gwangalliensis TaxID=501592 RepID=A0ABP8XGT7_9MICC